MSKKSAKRLKFSRPAAAFLIGPTASGKTDLVRELARRIPLEVISCDSMQVYREFRILSQAPPASLTRSVPHHEVGVLSVSKEYSAAQFVANARKQIPGILRRGRLPLIAGGTGLYAHALLDGIFEGPDAQPRIRRELDERAAKEGAPALHRELAALDPEAAAPIHPNDARRIIRALEVIRISGEKFSDLKRRRKGIWGEWAVKIWGLEWERSELYRRIDERVERMFRSGARAEVRRLIGRKRSRTAAGCLGLREIQSWLLEDVSKEKTIADIQMNTRRYAKRQICWWNRDTRVEWLRRDLIQKPSDLAVRMEKDIWEWLRREAVLAQ